MAEDQAKTEESGQGAEALSSEAVQSLISKALGEAEEKYKSELAGLNRKVSELTKERDDVKAEAENKVKSAMSEAERREHDLMAKMDATMSRLDKAEREASMERNKNYARERIKQMGLPDSLMEMMSFDSQEAVEKSIETGKGLVEALRSEESARQSQLTGTNVPNVPVADGKTVVKRSEFDTWHYTKKQRFVGEGGTVID